jgi:hypothetical protein
MSEELKQKLEAGLEAQGLDKGLSKFITIKDEGEIQGALKLLKLEEKPIDVKKALENKEVMKEIDRRVSQGIRTYKEKNPPVKPEKKDDEPKDDENSKEIRALKEKLEALERKRTLSEKNSFANKLFKDAELPEYLRSSLVVSNDTTEDDISKSVESLKKSHAEHMQSFLDKSIKAGGVPIHTKKEKITEEEAKAFLIKN